MKSPNFRVFLLEQMKHLLQDCVYGKLLPPRTAEQAAMRQATKNWLLLIHHIILSHHILSGKSLTRVCVTHPWQNKHSLQHVPQTPVLGNHVAVGMSQTIAAPGLNPRTQSPRLTPLSLLPGKDIAMARAAIRMNLSNCDSGWCPVPLIEPQFKFLENEAVRVRSTYSLWQFLTLQRDQMQDTNQHKAELLGSASLGSSQSSQR